MADINMKKVGRLALRVEGQWWCAYYAQTDTMDRAIRLGKVHMGVVADEQRKQAFIDLMSSFVGELIEQATGHHPDWRIEGAPDHERKP